MKKNIKGVILAGGLGTRLMPLTKITNKHLLPVYDEPMIFYPIRALVDAGIKDVVLVTGGNHSGDFMRLLGNGKKLGLNTLHYAYQEGEGGIAEALGLVQHITKDDHLAVVLGDNIFQYSLKDAVQKYQKQNENALIAVKKVPDPERFGVISFNKGKVDSIVEKPKKPKSSYAVTGFYCYDSGVFDIVRELKPSRRGELEITDVNNAYIKKNDLTCYKVKGWWSDCGTFESLYRTTCLIEKNRGR